MLTRRTEQERGDTLVEVLLGLAILSIITVGAFTLMNKGISQSLTALEQSQVRTNINRQTELLTYFRDQYAATKSRGLETDTYPSTVWAEIKSRAANNNGQTVRSFDDCSGYMQNAFYLTYDPAAGDGGEYVVNDMTAANMVAKTLAMPGEGLWIEPKAGANTNITGFQPYVDLYVKGCWTPLSNATNQALSSAVRLYDTP